MIEMGNDNPRFDSTRGQGRILATLKMKDGIKTKDLSYILGITVVSLNETLAKLEKAGFIVRKPYEQDKRVMLIYLTKAGRNAIPEEPEKEEINYFECLNEEEQQIFAQYLDRVIEHMQQALGEQSSQFSEQMQKAAQERERIFRETGMFQMGIDSRGPAPEGIPGAERFRKDYNGPFPSGNDRK
ncbi:MAG: MarR family transcriptional regulator [Lachnospiraceae bacterium]|nr:MarR family transcriptional regulator [Lachnospiraceae bacterium]